MKLINKDVNKVTFIKEMTDNVISVEVSSPGLKSTNVDIKVTNDASHSPLATALKSVNLANSDFWLILIILYKIMNFIYSNLLKNYKY